jgi:hypothetical protein
MSKHKTTPVTINLNLSLTPEVYEYLETNSGGDVQKSLASWVAYYLTQQSQGGMMLTAVDHAYLAKLRDGKRFAKSVEVVKMIESALKRVDSQYTQHVPIDPAWIGPLQETAEMMGVTVEQLLTDLVNTVVENGWAYEWRPAHQIRFTEADFAKLQQFMGKVTFFGSDLIQKLFGEPEAASEEVKEPALAAA